MGMSMSSPMSRASREILAEEVIDPSQILRASFHRHSEVEAVGKNSALVWITRTNQVVMMSGEVSNSVSQGLSRIDVANPAMDRHFEGMLGRSRSEVERPMLKV